MEKPVLIDEIRIKNYKSLRDVTFRPGRFSVLIGPNASGKSNFADAIDFIKEFYTWGLGKAIRIKGGLGKIAFKNQKSYDEKEIHIEGSFFIPLHGNVEFFIGD